MDVASYEWLAAVMQIVFALRDAGAPRWTIRAVRLACQVKLPSGDRRAVWQELRSLFDEISAVEGERWAEVPIEALVPLGNAQAAIETVWDDLVADDQAGLGTLLRLARQQIRDRILETDPQACYDSAPVARH